MENQNKLPDHFSMQEAMRLASTPAGQQLIALLQQQGGSDLQKAMARASSGDYKDAKQAIEAMAANPQVQQLLKQLGG